VAAPRPGSAQEEDSSPKDPVAAMDSTDKGTLSVPGPVEERCLVPSIVPAMVQGRLPFPGSTLSASLEVGHLGRLNVPWSMVREHPSNLSETLR